MSKVIILKETTKNPITLIGERAGVCWGGDIIDAEKNYKRGLDCIKSNHGRTLEFVNVEMILDGWSARVIREWYTHIGGSPTRLQASTRYINYGKFDYYVPESIQKSENALNIYRNCMYGISVAYKELQEAGIPKEDIANLLPLGMETRIVDKRNLRNLIDMSHQRMCTRAYHEYRDLFNSVVHALEDYSDEWKTVIEMTFKPKCELNGQCPETHSCGRVNDWI